MGYQALYRQLRPQGFEDIVGQTHVTRTLSNAIKNQRIAHAYLFSGPRGVGKTSTARILAKAVNCDLGPTAKPCGTCRLCTSISNNSSMDVLEIDAASNNGVDEIRDLREKVKYSPTDCRYKVYIIDEVHMLSTAAFNALLKTLEEPPAHVIFILATTEVHKIPATILSRCQRFDFHRISVEDIIKHLNDIAAIVDIKLEEKAAQLIARAADGALRDAISILDQCLSYSSDKVSVEDTANLLGTVGDEKFLQLTEFIYNTNIVAAFELVQDVHQKGKDLEQFVSDYLQYLKILLQLESGIEDAYLILDSVDKAKQQASNFGKAKLLHLIHCMVTVSNEIKYADNKAIILEMGLVESQYFLGDTIYELKSRIDDLEQRLERQEGVSPPPLTVREQQGSPKEEQIPANSRSEQPKPAANEIEHKQELKQEHKQEHMLTDTAPEIVLTSSVPPETKMSSEVTADEAEGAKEAVKVVQFAIVQRKWAQVLEGVRESSVIVHALLREATPRSLKEGILSLQFANDFHQEEMMKSDKRQVLESVLENIFGAKLSIKGQKGERATDEATAQPGEVYKPSEDSTDVMPSEDSGLQQVLEIFGGKLIERKDAK